jgi:hypothetical protein
VNYWLTTHYPHDRPGIPYFVLLPTMPESGAGPQTGDTVFFYETVTPGPASASGVGAIVQVGTVTGEARPVRGNYSGGRPFEIPCDSRPAARCIPMSKLRELGGPKVLLTRKGYFALEHDVGKAIDAATKPDAT